MTGDLGGIGEGLGDLASGAALARAVEPETGGDRGHTHEAGCLNCGTSLVGPHCHSCGQRAHVHRTIGAFFHDLVHGVLHFEGKTWHTLPLLVFRPGRLTREYIDGRRARYVSPIALFLFCVFAMFAVFQMAGGGSVDGSAKVVGVPDAIAGQEKRVAQLEEELAKASDTGKAQELRARLADEKEDLAALRGFDDPEIKDAAARELGGVPVIGGVVTAAQENPELFAYKMQTYAYKYSWMLIPISVPFMWLLFPFSRRFHLYDHTVFVTYSLCFVTLLAITGMLLNAAGLTALAALLVFLPPLHMYRQLKGTYALGRFGALVRTVLLTGFSGAALVIFFAVIGAQTGG